MNLESFWTKQWAGAMLLEGQGMLRNHHVQIFNSLTVNENVLDQEAFSIVWGSVLHIHSPLIRFSPVVLKIMTPDPLSFFSSHTQPALLSGTVEHMASSFPTAANSNLTANQSSPVIHWSCPVCPQKTPVTLHVCWLLITAVYWACTYSSHCGKLFPYTFCLKYHKSSSEVCFPAASSP